MSDILAGYIIKNKAKTISFLRKNKIRVSPSDSILDISDKLHDYASQSEENFNKATDLVTEGKSGFAFLSAIFGGETAKENLEASKNNTQASIISQLTTKDNNSSYLWIASAIMIIVVGIVVYIIMKKK